MIDDRLIANLRHNFGQTVMGALEDPNIEDIILNSDGRLWVKRFNTTMCDVGTMQAAQGRLIISLIASALDTVITPENPIVEGELPIDGSRFEGAMPPICSAPSFAIRKKASKVFTLASYIESGIMDASLFGTFSTALQRRKNILVVGGTGSGKTTFVNALIGRLSELCPQDRLLILEDTRELQSLSANSQFYKTSDYVDMTRLLRMTMRLKPDRLLIGEVRDGAALALLKAWNTGHPGGIATVHANSALEGLDRLEELIAEATPAAKQRLIGNAVDKIIFLNCTPEGREISEVLSVRQFDYRSNTYQTEYVYQKHNITRRLQ